MKAADARVPEATEPPPAYYTCDCGKLLKEGQRHYCPDPDDREDVPMDDGGPGADHPLY